jgi:hypothetical protein
MNQKTNLHVTGNIKGLKTGTLYIQRVVDSTLVAIDTIVIDGSSLLLKVISI